MVPRGLDTLGFAKKISSDFLIPALVVGRDFFFTLLLGSHPTHSPCLSFPVCLTCTAHACNISMLPTLCGGTETKRDQDLMCVEEGYPALVAGCFGTSHSLCHPLQL